MGQTENPLYLSTYLSHTLSKKSFESGQREHMHSGHMVHQLETKALVRACEKRGKGKRRSDLCYTQKATKECPRNHCSFHRDSKVGLINEISGKSLSLSHSLTLSLGSTIDGQGVPL